MHRATLAITVDINLDDRRGVSKRLIKKIRLRARLVSHFPKCYNCKKKLHFSGKYIQTNYENFANIDEILFNSLYTAG